MCTSWVTGCYTLEIESDDRILNIGYRSFVSRILPSSDRHTVLGLHILYYIGDTE